MDPRIERAGRAYLAIAEGAERWGRPALLLAIRVCWGTQFAQTGWGKLANHDRVAAWFADDLGLPFPHLNAWMAGGTEFFGGILLLLGLGGRLAAAPLAFTMCVAFATSDLDALRAITWTEWDPALEAAPFLFLFAAVIVLVFGSGPLSVDGLIERAWRARVTPPR